MNSLIVFVLLASCALLTVNGKVARSQPDSSEQSSREQCGELILPCLQEMSQYTGSQDFTDTIQGSTIRTHCSRLVSTTQCFKHAESQSVCREIMSLAELQKLSQLVDLIHYACVDKIEDLVKHTDCFKDTKFDREFETCIETNFNVITCDPESLVTCAAAAMRDTPNCDSDSVALLRDIAPKFLKFAAGCEGPKMLRQMFKKFF